MFFMLTKNEVKLSKGITIVLRNWMMTLTFKYELIMNKAHSQLFVVVIYNQLTADFNKKTLL